MDSYVLYWLTLRGSRLFFFERWEKDNEISKFSKAIDLTSWVSCPLDVTDAVCLLIGLAMFAAEFACPKTPKMWGPSFLKSIHQYIYIYINTYIHTYVRTYIHTYMHACMHTCNGCMHAYIHTCMHASMHACIHTYIHACMHACIHTYIHTCMHTCMHACMHACIHTYIHTNVKSYLNRAQVNLFSIFFWLLYTFYTSWTSWNTLQRGGCAHQIQRQGAHPTTWRGGRHAVSIDPNSGVICNTKWGHLWKNILCIPMYVYTHRYPYPYGCLYLCSCGEVPISTQL